jgi:hypothetical protein
MFEANPPKFQQMKDSAHEEWPGLGIRGLLGSSLIALARAH